jgi:hypothetical protein
LNKKVADWVKKSKKKWGEPEQKIVKENIQKAIYQKANVNIILKY